MSLTASLIVVIAAVVILLGGLALVMSRPKQLRPHRHTRRPRYGDRGQRRRDAP